MYLKYRIALIATLGAFVCAAPTLSRAEDQSQWLQRQLQMTDGYAPPPLQSALDTARGRTQEVRVVPPQVAEGVAPAPRHRKVLHRPAKVDEVAKATVCDEACEGSAPLAAEPEESAAEELSEAVCAECQTAESLQTARIEPPPVQVTKCAECVTAAIPEQPAPEGDRQGKGMGFAAFVTLLAFVGFKVMKTVGTF